jgi:hypothetical protein
LAAIRRQRDNLAPSFEADLTQQDPDFSGSRSCRGEERGNLVVVIALMNGKEAPMTRNNPQNSPEGDPAARRQTHASAPPQPLNPGDEAARGTPGTGEDICPKCHGSGHIDGSRCLNCGGTGKIVKAIGGA